MELQQQFHDLYYVLYEYMYIYCIHICTCIDVMVEHWIALDCTGVPNKTATACIYETEKDV